MQIDLSLRPSAGLEQGSNFQFVEGRWPPCLVRVPGIAIDEAAFGFVEPLLARAWVNRPAGALYGTSLMPTEACAQFSQELRGTARQLRARAPPRRSEALSGEFTAQDLRAALAAVSSFADDLAELFERLADWVEDANARGPISFLGI